MKTPIQELIDEMTYMLTEGERSIYAQNKGKIVRLSIQNKGKSPHCMQIHITNDVR